MVSGVKEDGVDVVREPVMRQRYTLLIVMDFDRTSKQPNEQIEGFYSHSKYCFLVDWSLQLSQLQLFGTEWTKISISSTTSEISFLL